MRNVFNGDFNSMEKFLFELRNAGSKFSLERIEALCGALGRPQDKFRSAHVAGTNGKGSCCAMIESILRASGLKTGMFTSPHLLYLGERVQIDRCPIGRGPLMEYIGRVREACSRVFGDSITPDYPSFFEFMTAAAFLYFADENVDAAVVEVGLGGRLDSTNIITPELSVITSIGFDHTEYLGDTLTAIASEKAGIIKAGAPVVAGFLPEEAMRVVEAAAMRHGSALYKAADYFSPATLPETSLAGAYQRRNAAVAKLCAEVLRGRGGAFSGITGASIDRGLKSAVWAARWQKIALNNGAELILDASHNEEGARSLEENLASLAASGVKPAIAVGVLGESRARPLLGVVAKYAREIYLLVPDQPRATGFDALESMLQTSVPVYRETVAGLFGGGVCRRAKAGETVVCTGSIYLAGEVLSALSGSCADGLSDLI